MTLLTGFSADLAPPDPMPSPTPTPTPSLTTPTDLAPEPPTPTPTTPADLAAGGLDPSTIAMVVLALLVVAGIVWILIRRQRAS